MQPKYVIGLVGAAVAGGVVVHALGLAIAPMPGPPEKPTLEGCLDVVFRSSTEERRKGQVKAAAEYVAKGSVDSAGEGERRAFYRDLDSAAVRQAINACSVVYGPQKELKTNLPVNVRFKGSPAVGATVSLRNQIGVDCITRDGGRCELPAPMSALNKDEIPLGIEYYGAYKDATTSFSKLQEGETVDLDVEMALLEVQLVDCKQRLITEPLQITLETRQRAWGLSCGDHPGRPNDPVRDVALDGTGRFRYEGSLGTFAVNVSTLSGGRALNAAERYEGLQTSGSTLKLSYPRQCLRDGPPTPKVNCDELARNIQQRLESQSGTHYQPVTVKPGVGGVSCTPQAACNLSVTLPPGSEQCPSFVARAKVE